MFKKSFIIFESKLQKFYLCAILKDESINQSPGPCFFGVMNESFHKWKELVIKRTFRVGGHGLTCANLAISLVYWIPVEIFLRICIGLVVMHVGHALSHQGDIRNSR
jgi:hypothetical protein